MRLGYRALILGLFIFMLGPLVVTIAVSFNGGTIAAFPPHNLSLRWYAAALHNEAFRSAVSISLLLGLGAALFGCAFGMLAALGIHRCSAPGKGLVQTVL